MTSPPVDLSVAVNGVDLRCTTVGDGPTVILLHAGGERRQVWRPVADRLAARGVRVVSVDQRGHGETAGRLGATLDVYADDVTALVGSLDVPVVLVGCSLGGLAALLATTDPDTRHRVESLVLVDVVPDPDPVRARRQLRAIEPRPTRNPAGAWEWSLIENILDRAPVLRRAAADLRVPVTLVRGTSSWAIDAVDQQRFVALVPHAELVEIVGAGHLVARDRPAQLAEALLAHLSVASP